MAEIAIIGSGIAGLGCAWWLTECGHNVTVYAGGPRVGGQCHTVLANAGQGMQVPVDVGFTAYTPKGNPNLEALLTRLGVISQLTEASFAASLYEGEIEYSTRSPLAFFAQLSLLASPAHWNMLRELLRFNKQAPDLLNSSGNPTLFEYLQSQQFSDAFVSRYLVPLACTIWGVPPADMMQMPARHLIGALLAHGLLARQPADGWETISGGSIELIRKLTEKFASNMIGAPATRIKRTGAGPLVECQGSYKPYAAVVLACPADQALMLVQDPTEAERELLGAFRFINNSAVLHQDDSLMPKRGAAWSSWNFLTHPNGKASYSCWMNNLQDLDDETPLYLTVNPPRQPAVSTVLASTEYSQPVFDTNAVTAQAYLGHLQGEGGLWYCGAWTGYGLHEDALTSGLTVAEYISGAARPWTVREASPAAGNVAPVQQTAEAAA